MASIIPNLRNRIINDPTGVKAELKGGTSVPKSSKIGTESVPSGAEKSIATPTKKVEQASDKSIPSHSHSSSTVTIPSLDNNFISYKVPIDVHDLLKLAQCDKCKLKGTCKGVVEGWE